MAIDTSAIFAAVADESDSVIYRVAIKTASIRVKLNIIDCAAYALARSRDLLLLFKGSDFAHTDVTSALAKGAADPEAL